MRVPPSLALPVVLALALARPLVAAEVDPGDPRAIMKAVRDRDDGDDAVSDLEMVLIDKRGNERIRRIRSYSKDFGEDDYSLMFFESPADVKDTGFLSYDYEDEERDDDQWLYLPALKKTKRIATGDKSGAFMGSDFSYADMTERPLKAYDYRLLEESEVRGQPVWVIESVPRTEKEIDETGYTRSVVFVRKDNFVVVRAKSWLKKGQREKYLDVLQLEQVDGIWVPTEMTMTTKKGKATLHKTVLRNQNVRFNQSLDADLFSTRRLEKGL